MKHIFFDEELFQTYVGYIPTHPMKLPIFIGYFNEES